MQAPLYSCEIIPDPAGLADLFTQRLFGQADADTFCGALERRCAFRCTYGCREVRGSLNIAVTRKYQLILGSIS